MVTIQPRHIITTLTEKINKFIEKRKFEVYKRALIQKGKQSNPLIAYPFIMFVEISLNPVFEMGGLKAVEEAVLGWGDITKEKLEHGLELIDGDNDTEYEYTGRITVKYSKGTLKLERHCFDLACSLIKEMEPLVGGKIPTINGHPLSPGRFLRPGDVVIYK